MVAQQIEAALPQTLRLPEPAAPASEPLKASFRVSNPTQAVLWLRFTTRPFYFKITPSTVSLRPLRGETITAEIDSAQVNPHNQHSIEIVAAWSLLETDPATGKSSTRNGEHAIQVQAAPPRRSFACPDPECARPILAGDRLCKACGLLLQFCPKCGSPAARTAAACTGLAHHPLARPPDWPVPGGNAGRSAFVNEILAPQASLAWKYAPAPPKPSTIIEWSAPTIAYGMVFLAGTVPGEWSRVIALDLETGAELWQAPLPENDPVYPYRGGPSVANGSVYVATTHGYVLAVDAGRGKRRWAARVPHQIYGGCLAAGTGLFVGTVHPDEAGGHLIALWPADGEVVWTVELGGKLDTPIAARQGLVYACADDQQVYALRAADGSVAWKQPAGSGFDAGPVVESGQLVCGTVGGELIAVDAVSGEPHWKETLPAAIEASPAIFGSRVYCGCADGSLYCYSGEGKRVGSAAVGAQIRAAPLPAKNGVLFGAEDGTLYFSDAIRQVTPLYQTEPGTRISSPLAASGRRVVMATTNGAVYAIEVGAA